MTSLRATLRPLRTELLGVAGLTALLLLAAGSIAARLAAFGIPPECFELVNGESACLAHQLDVYAYQSFAGNWGGAVAIAATILPAIAGVILGTAAVAKELDQRTTVLAWSVDSSRRHWLLQRVVPLLGVIVVLGILSTQLVAAMLRLTSGDGTSLRSEDSRPSRTPASVRWRAGFRPSASRWSSVRCSVVCCPLFLLPPRSSYLPRS